MEYFTCSFRRKIIFLKCGDNEGPVATFVATLVIGLDTADLVLQPFSYLAATQNPLANPIKLFFSLTKNFSVFSC